MNGKQAVWYGVGVDTSGLEKGRIDTKKIWQQMEGDAARTGASIEKIWKKVGTGIGLVIGAATMKEFIGNMVRIRGEFQQLEIAFTTMLKSAEKSKKLMADLTKFAAETPFGLQSAASGAKQLIAYGSTAETVIDELRMLGDVAAGTGQSINDLVYLYGTLRTQGRAYMTDIRQFAGRGIPIYDELAKVLNTSKDKVNEFVSAGKVGFTEVEQAFKNMTSAGGMYGGLMEEQSKSVTGRIEQLKDAIDTMFNEIGKSNEGVVYSAISGAASLVENYEKVGKILIGLIATYGAYRTAVMLTAATEGGWTVVQLAHYRALLLVEKAQKLLNKTMLANPYVLMATVVVGLVAAMWALHDSTTAEERARKNLNDELEKSKEQKNALIGKANELIRTIKSETESLYAQMKALRELKKEFPEVFAAMTLAEVKNMSVPEIEAKISVVVDEREFKEAEDRIKRIEAEIAEKRQLESVPSSAGGVTYVSNMQSQIKQLNADLKVAKEHFEEITKLRKEAEFEAKPTGEKLEYYQRELDSLVKQREAIERMLFTSSGLSEAWGGYDLQTRLTERNLASISGKIDEISGKMRGLTGADSGIKNKAYWEGQKEKAESELAAMDAAKKGTEEWLKWQKQLNEANAALKTWDFTGKAGRAEESAADRARKEAEAVVEQQQKIALLMDDQARERKRATEDLQNQATQAEIDAMQDGFEKTQRQRAHNNAVEIQNLERQKEDYIRAVIEAEKKLFEENEELEKKKDKKYNKKPFDPATVTVDTSQYDKIISDTETKHAAKEKEDIEELARQYQDYYTKRLKTIEKFQKDRDRLEKSGASKESLAELDYQQGEAVKAIDNEFAMREKSFQIWTDQVVNLSLKKLQELLAEAEAELARMEAANPEDSALATQRAKIEEIRSNIYKKQAEDNLSPGKRTLKEWKDLHDVLSSVSKDFEEIGDAVGGAAGEIIKTAGGVASSSLSMVNSIVQLSNWAAISIQRTAEGASKAMIAVEKASVILTIISTVIKLLQQLDELIPDAHEQYQKFADKIAEINKMTDAVRDYELAVLKAKHAEDSWFAEDGLRSLRQGWEMNGKALEAYQAKLNEKQAVYQNKSGGGWLTENLLGFGPQLILGDDYNKAVTAAMNNLRIETRKASKGFLGSGIGGKSQKTEDLVEWVKKNMGVDLFGEDGMLNIEAAKAVLSQHNENLVGQTQATLEALVELQEKYDEYLKNLREYVSSLYEPLVNNFVDAIWDWLDTGKDALTSFKEYASDTFRDIVSDMIRTLVLANVFKGFEDDIAAIYKEYAEGGLTEEEMMAKVAERTAALSKDAESGLPVIQKIVESVAGTLKDVADIDIRAIDEAARTASQKSYTAASQDSIDKVWGVVTNIQGHTYNIQNNTFNISENIKLMNANVAVMNDNLAAIRHNTDHLQAMQADLRQVRVTVDDMRMNGITMSK